MNEIYAWKKKFQELYYSKSRYIDMGVKFIISLLVFSFINGHIGFMGALDKFSIVLLLSIVCSVLPYGFLLVLAPLVMVLHIYSVSLVLAGCVAVVFLMMFIVYFRFTAEMVLVVLLTPIALGFNMVYVVPIVCGLLIGPVAIIPMSCGVIVYSLIGVLENISINGELSMDGMLEDCLNFVSALLEQKDAMFYIVVLSITLCIVFVVKQFSYNHIWKIAMGSGCLTSLILGAVVSGILEVEISMVALFFGNILAAIIALGAEIIFMGVDYKKVEVTEFEDDEYHYYVKAVPKIVPEGQKKGTKKRKKPVPEIEEVEETEELLDTYEADLELEDLDDISEDVESEFSKHQEELDELEELLDELDKEQSSDNMDATMVIETDEIERELRNNAHQKSQRTQNNRRRHVKTNYEMLEKSMKEKKDLE